MELIELMKIDSSSKHRLFYFSTISWFSTKAPTHAFLPCLAHLRTVNHNSHSYLMAPKLLIAAFVQCNSKPLLPILLFFNCFLNLLNSKPWSWRYSLIHYSIMSNRSFLKQKDGEISFTLS